MVFIRRFYSVALWVILIGLGGYYTYLLYGQPAPCTQAITYRIGALDPRFGISTSTFLADIDAASNIWDVELNKKLFTYDPHGELTINLIYDDRQAVTETEQKLSGEIKSTTAVADSVKAEYQSLKSQYNQASRGYDALLAQFYKDEAAYTSQVKYWNTRGGAPSAQYDKLSAQRQDLQAKQKTLENKRVTLNNLAAQVNALIDKYNLLVDHINENVSTYNTDGLAGTEFEEGFYIRDRSGERINIYQFDSKTAFVRVISHELGHALGLEHNNNPDSIMNPINSSQSMNLSSDDLAALKEVCRIK